MSSLLVYKPANLFIIVSKYFFPIPLLKISSVTISADVFLYQPEFPWLNSSNIYLLTLLNTQYVSFKQEIKELELIQQNLSKYLKQEAPEIQRSSHNKLPSL